MTNQLWKFYWEKNRHFVPLVLGILFFLVPHGWGASGYGGESQVQSFFDGTAGFLIKTVGTGVFIIGMIVAGIKIAAGDQNGLRSAVLVMIGGAIIFLSKPLVGVLSRFAGGN